MPRTAKTPVVDSNEEDLSDYAEDVEDDIDDMSVDDESLGSLREFIVEDDDDEESEHDNTEDDDATDNFDSDDDDVVVTEDEDIHPDIHEGNIVTGKRERKVVNRYIPEDLGELMINKGGKTSLDELELAIAEDDLAALEIEDSDVEDPTYGSEDLEDDDSDCDFHVDDNE